MINIISLFKSVSENGAKDLCFFFLVLRCRLVLLHWFCSSALPWPLGFVLLFWDLQF